MRSQIWIISLFAGFGLATSACNEAIDTDGILFGCNTDDDCLDGYRCQFPQAGVNERACVPASTTTPTTTADMMDGDGDMTDACGGVCRTGESCVDGICTCGDEIAAAAGESVCASGEACCAGRCIDPTSPVCDCGGNGACGIGEDCCGDVCLNVVDEPDRCGACDNLCGGGAAACLVSECTEADALVAGAQHTCARYADGRVLCWGSEANGRLGYAVSGGDNPRMPDVFVGTELRFDAIAAGKDFTCGYADGTVSCWGSTSIIGGSGGPEPEAADLGGATATAVFAGGTTACAVTDAGTLSCAGSDAGAAGHDGSGFAAVHDLSGVTLAALGTLHSCAWGTRAGTEAVWCWGASSGGRLGPDTPVGDAPVSVDLGGTPSAMVAGNGHTCAIVSNEVQCWGDNSQGQLGAMSPVSVGEPVAVDLPGGCAPTALTAGTLHTCALCGQDVVCWGNNGDGQLGRITAETAPGALENFAASAIAAGDTHTCALRSDGKAHCWGNNAGGQLGLGNTTAAATPTEVVGPVSP